MAEVIRERRRAPVVLHPTDFSPEAQVAEAEAERLARALDADLILLHVSVEAMLYGETPFGLDQVEKLYATQAQWAEKQLAERAQWLTSAGVKATWRRRTGVPHEEIVKTATDEAAAYIVMGTHGRGGFERFIIGSVAERVIRTAACPVLTVRCSDSVTTPTETVGPRR